MTKPKRRSTRSQSSSKNLRVLTVDEAFQRVLKVHKDPHRACGLLNRAIVDGRAQLMRRTKEGADGSVRIMPHHFAGNYNVIPVKEGRGWQGILELRVGGFVGGEDPAKYIWTMLTKEINALRKDETPPDTSLRRGPKGYGDDIWELFKARFYIKLDMDDVPAHADINDINIEQRAKELMLWGQNHPNVGAEKTPSSTAMRDKVKEWCPLWNLLGVRVPTDKLK